MITGKQRHMYTRELHNGQRLRRLTVIDTGVGGWEICDEADGGTLTRRLCTDWHRVERAIALFEREQDAPRRPKGLSEGPPPLLQSL